MSALVLITPPAAEPVTLSEVRRALNIGATDGEPAPGAPSVALSGSGAGNVDNGAHRYRITFVTGDGETDGGTVSGAVTVSDKTVNGKIALTGIPLGGSAVTARKLYRTAAGGGTYLLVATLADNTTTSYTDNISDASLGVGAPSTNTTVDPWLSMAIATARALAETATNRALMTQTWDLYLDGFPVWEIIVPKAPLQSVTSIAYVDSNGATQTIDPAQYQVDAVSEPGRITPAWGCVWPGARPQNNAVRIRFVCGYGAAAAVPGDIKTWMLMAIGTMYENRESVVVGPGLQAVELPNRFVDAMVSAHRVHQFSGGN